MDCRGKTYIYYIYYKENDKSHLLKWLIWNTSHLPASPGAYEWLMYLLPTNKEALYLFFHFPCFPSFFGFILQNKLFFTSSRQNTEHFLKWSSFFSQILFVWFSLFLFANVFLLVLMLLQRWTSRYYPSR